MYAGFFALINVAYNLLWWVVFRQKINYYALEPRLPGSMIISLLGLPCYLIAMVVAFWSPGQPPPEREVSSQESPLPPTEGGTKKELESSALMGA